MLASCIRAELVKLRRAPIWIVFVALPGVSALIGCANYQSNLGVITPGWANLWTQQTLFVCYFFLPALLGAGCSFLWRQEHQGSNWNEFMVQPVPIRDLVLAKFCVGSLMSLLAFISIVVFYVGSGVVIGVPGAFPAARIAEYVVLGILGSLVVVAIQLDVSMVVRNFAAPVGIALAGGVSGVIATVAGFGNIWPYSLLQTGMNSNELVDLSMASVIQIVILSAVYISGALAWACRRLSRRDVVATM
ncbi:MULTISPECIES: ABC transporter permease [Enorma]|uniref:ABC transporter permease n=1 Tax=Enorma TaxID=1472762 RepID=UPI00037CA39A|nr:MULTISPECIES: ABC transporter permease [Enorma]